MLQRRSWLQDTQRMQMCLADLYTYAVHFVSRNRLERISGVCSGSADGEAGFPSVFSPSCLKFLDIPVENCQFPDAEVMATRSTSVKQYHDDCIGLPSSPQKRLKVSCNTATELFCNREENTWTIAYENHIGMLWFFMETIVPVLLGQETPTNEQVYVWEAGEKGYEVLNRITELPNTDKWWKSW